MARAQRHSAFMCRTDDDGSSQYNATHNFLVYGAFKVRDGINRAHSHNLIYGKPADYQCDGFNSTTMEYNTVSAAAPFASSFEA